ncbi:hypothetical protein ABK040_010772 [Willaertia magna]
MYENDSRREFLSIDTSGCQPPRICIAKKKTFSLMSLDSLGEITPTTLGDTLLNTPSDMLLSNSPFPTPFQSLNSPNSSQGLSTPFHFLSPTSIEETFGSITIPSAERASVADGIRQLTPPDSAIPGFNYQSSLVWGTNNNTTSEQTPTMNSFYNLLTNNSEKNNSQCQNNNSFFEYICSQTSCEEVTPDNNNTKDNNEQSNDESVIHNEQTNFEEYSNPTTIQNEMINNSSIVDFNNFQQLSKNNSSNWSELECFFKKLSVENPTATLQLINVLKGVTENSQLSNSSSEVSNSLSEQHYSPSNNNVVDFSNVTLYPTTVTSQPGCWNNTIVTNQIPPQIPIQQQCITSNQIINYDEQSNNESYVSNSIGPNDTSSTSFEQYSSCQTLSCKENKKRSKKKNNGSSSSAIGGNSSKEKKLHHTQRYRVRFEKNNTLPDNVTEKLKQNPLLCNPIKGQVKFEGNEFYDFKKGTHCTQQQKRRHSYDSNASVMMMSNGSSSNSSGSTSGGNLNNNIQFHMQQNNW